MQRHVRLIAGEVLGDSFRGFAQERIRVLVLLGKEPVTGLLLLAFVEPALNRSGWCLTAHHQIRRCSYCAVGGSHWARSAGQHRVDIRASATLGQRLLQQFIRQRHLASPCHLHQPLSGCASGCQFRLLASALAKGFRCVGGQAYFWVGREVGDAVLDRLQLPSLDGGWLGQALKRQRLVLVLVDDREVIPDASLPGRSRKRAHHHISIRACRHVREDVAACPGCLTGLPLRLGYIARRADNLCQFRRIHVGVLHQVAREAILDRQCFRFIDCAQGSGGLVFGDVQQHFTSGFQLTGRTALHALHQGIAAGTGSYILRPLRLSNDISQRLADLLSASGLAQELPHRLGYLGHAFLHDLGRDGFDALGCQACALGQRCPRNESKRVSGNIPQEAENGALGASWQRYAVVLGYLAKVRAVLLGGELWDPVAGEGGINGTASQVSEVTDNAARLANGVVPHRLTRQGDVVGE